MKLSKIFENAVLTVSMIIGLPGFLMAMNEAKRKGLNPDQMMSQQLTAIQKMTKYEDTISLDGSYAALLLYLNLLHDGERHIEPPQNLAEIFPIMDAAFARTKDYIEQSGIDKDIEDFGTLEYEYAIFANYCKALDPRVMDMTTRMTREIEWDQVLDGFAPDAWTDEIEAFKLYWSGQGPEPDMDLVRVIGEEREAELEEFVLDIKSTLQNQANNKPHPQV